jgi:hypothetical protein
MNRRKTLLLSLLLLAAVIATAIAYARMSKYRDDAQTAQANLLAARAAMTDIARWRSSPGRASAVGMETPQLTAKLREAAAAAGLADAPGSEAGAPARVANSDYAEMLVFLSFEPLTMKQLTLFLHTLARIDPSSRAKQIELSPPDQPGVAIAATPAAKAAGGEDKWTVGVAVGYLTYSPQKQSK